MADCYPGNMEGKALWHAGYYAGAARGGGGGQCVGPILGGPEVRRGDFYVALGGIFQLGLRK